MIEPSELIWRWQRFSTSRYIGRSRWPGITACPGRRKILHAPAPTDQDMLARTW